MLGTDEAWNQFDILEENYFNPKKQLPQTYKEALLALVDEIEEKEKIEQEREQLQIQLDESKDYYSIKRVALINGISWKLISWRELKRVSTLNGIDVVKIFDANYGEVNTYHRKVWELVYPDLKLDCEELMIID